METKRLIPYSVHLREDIYNALKTAAGQRKASGLVRDAITMIIEGDDEFTGGYNKGIRDAIKTVSTNHMVNGLIINGYNIQDALTKALEDLIVQKEKPNGKKKTRGN